MEIASGRKKDTSQTRKVWNASPAFREKKERRGDGSKRGNHGVAKVMDMTISATTVVEQHHNKGETGGKIV